jgi:lysophospholipase L1-like esterase
VGQDFSLKLKACSGAWIGDYFHAIDRSANNTKEDAQGEGVDKDNPKLVTLTFGGNDMGFATVLAECMTNIPQGKRGLYFDLLAYCDDEIKRAMTKVPTIVGTHDEIVKVGHRRVAKKREGLSELYTRLLHDAPQARIMVLGYPRLYDPVKEPKLVPVPSPSPDKDKGSTPVPSPVPVPSPPDDCHTTIAGLIYVHTPEEQKKANALVDQLNDTIAKTVTEVNKEQDTDRLVYVNVSDAFKNGGICEPKGKRLVNDLIRDERGSRSQSFHPNAEGQEKLADRVVECYSKISRGISSPFCSR